MTDATHYQHMVAVERELIEIRSLLTELVHIHREQSEDDATLADDGAGGDEPDPDAVLGMRAIKGQFQAERSVPTGPADATPPGNDARGEALEAWEVVKSLINSPRCQITQKEWADYRSLLDTIHQYFTAPPTVPEAVRRLAEEMRHQYFNHNNGAADARLLEWASRLLNAYDPATPEQWEEGMPHRDDPPSPPAPDHWEEGGWVIEHADSEVCEPLYWTGSQDEPWSADHEKALRFARERDAGVMAIHALAGTGVRIAEHAWDRFANELDRALAQHGEPEKDDE